MLEVIEVAGGVIQAIVAWRFSVCAIGGSIAGWFAMDLVQPGAPRAIVFCSALAFGVIIGTVWNSRHASRGNGE